MALQVQLAQQQALAHGGSPLPFGLLSKDKEYVDLEDLAHLNHADSSNDSEPDMATNLSSGHSSNTVVHSTPPKVIEIKPEGSGSKAQPSTLAKLANKLQNSALGDSLNLTIPGGVKKEEPVAPVGDYEQESEASLSTPSSLSASPSFIPKVSPPVNEKRERDESWKKYLTRYC